MCAGLAQMITGDEMVHLGLAYGGVGAGSNVHMIPTSVVAVLYGTMLITSRHSKFSPYVHVLALRLRLN
jgi:hypothetical protein